jgi:hypothetical protein
MQRGANLLLATLATSLLLLLAYTTASRITFPYELEWLEGWTVDSMRRVLEGKPLFVEPSLEWVPYIYTPLYTYLSAVLAKIIGIGFLAPRLISLASAAGCLALTFSLVRRETGNAYASLAAAGLLAGTYPQGGSWFDVARVDTLFLLFLLAAFRVMRAAPSTRRSAAAGVLVALAYLTKQTALLPLVGLGLYGLFELRGWNRLVLPAVAGAIIGGSTLLFNFMTDGWYYFYTVTVPRLHGFGREEKLVGYWTEDLGWTVVPAALVGAAYLLVQLREVPRGRPARFVFYATLTVSMVGAAWISRLHGGGWWNVLQPAHAMLALLFGLALGDLTSSAHRARAAAAAVYLLATVQLGLLFYNPASHIPTERDVADGDAFVQALREIDGEVYTPMHGYLPTLAGKQVFSHDGYLLTILRTGHGPVVEKLVAEFDQAFAARRFAAVVIDFEDYRFMNRLEAHYRFAHELPGSFRPRRGPRGHPQKLYLPRADAADRLRGGRPLAGRSPRGAGPSAGAPSPER